MNLNDISALVGAQGGDSLGTLYVKLTADASKLLQGMQQAERAVQKGADGMLASVTKMATGITIALGSIGIAAVREAALFESSFTGVRKTVNATEEEFQKLQASFRQMSREMPTNIHQLNKIAEIAGQLGIENEQLVSFTKVIADLGNTTNLLGEHGATQLARFANITRMSQKDFDRLSSSIVELGNNMATTEAEIMTMALRIAGAGTQIGMSEAQILAFAAALSSVGIEAEMGGSAISRVMMQMAQAVAQGGEVLEKFADVAGMTMNQFSDSFEKDATATIMAFLRGLKRMSDAGEDVFTTLEGLEVEGVRIIDVLMRSSSAVELVQKSLNLSTQAWKDNKALVVEANLRYGTFISQLTITWNQIKDILITIGDMLIPHLRELNKAMQEWNEKLLANSRDTGTLNAIVATCVDLVKGFALGVAVLWTALKSLGILIGQSLGAQLEVLLTLFGALLEMMFSLGRVAQTLSVTFLKMADSINKSVQIFFAVLLQDWEQANKLSEELLKERESLLKDSWNIIKQEAVNAGKIQADALKKTFTISLGAITQSTNDIKKEWEDLVNFAVKLFPAFRTEIQSLVPPVQQVQKAVEKVVETMKKASLGLGLDGSKGAVPLGLQPEEVNQMLNKMGAPKDNAEFRQLMLGGQGMTGLTDPTVFQAQRLDAEIQAAQEHLATLEEINNSEVELTEEMLARKELAHRLYSERLRELKQAENILVVQTAQTMFDDLANITAAWAGKQSGVFKAMFAISKAFAIAESIIKIQQGIANAMSLPFPANLAAVGSVIAATSSIVSTIQSVQLTFGGARRFGGGVEPGRTYTVGENGPESFTPMVPGFVSPNEARAGGGGVKVVVNNYTDARPQVTEREENGERVVEVTIRRAKAEIAAEIRDGRGDVTRSLEQSFGLKRGAA